MNDRERDDEVVWGGGEANLGEGEKEGERGKDTENDCTGALHKVEAIGLGCDCWDKMCV